MISSSLVSLFLWVLITSVSRQYSLCSGMKKWHLFPPSLFTIKHISFLYIISKCFSTSAIDSMLEIFLGSYHIWSGYPVRYPIILVQDTPELPRLFIHLSPSIIFFIRDPFDKIFTLIWMSSRIQISGIPAVLMWNKKLCYSLPDNLAIRICNPSDLLLSTFSGNIDT